MVRFTDLIKGPTPPSSDPPRETSFVKTPPGSDPQPTSHIQGTPSPQQRVPPESSDRAKPAAASKPVDWYALAKAGITQLASAVQKQSPLDFKNIPPIADGMVKELSANEVLLTKALIPSGPSLIENMVNVAIFSIKVGLGLGYNVEQLRKLGLAALVHDLGMFRLPPALLENDGRWSKEQQAVLQRHPLTTAELVQPLKPHFQEISKVLAQEHERINGKGYPKGLQGNQIHEFAQIIGLADLLDAVLRTRPYRPTLLPYQAIRQILITEKETFANPIIKALVQQCSLYPAGTYVRLNTGDIGIVRQSNPRFPLRPLVQVTQAANPTPTDEPKMVDLSKTPLVHIMEVLNPDEME